MKRSLLVLLVLLALPVAALADSKDVWQCQQDAMAAGATIPEAIAACAGAIPAVEAAVPAAPAPPASAERVGPPQAWGHQGPTYGIDISEYNVIVDWGAIAARYDFVYIRAGHGRRADTKQARRVDKMLATHYANAKAHGLKVGLYYVVSSLEGYGDQALAFIDLLAQYPTDLPPAADIELPGLTAKGIAHFLWALDETGYAPIIYTSQSCWARVGNPAWSINYRLWVASWHVASPRIPSPWTDYYIWQFEVANAGTVAGAPGRIDQDVKK